MKLIYFISIITITFSNQIVGQKSILDSLRKEIEKNSKPDTLRIKAITWYLKEAFNNNSSDLLPFIKELTILSKKNKYKAGIAKGYIASQIYFHDRGDYPKAILYCDSSKNILFNDTTLKARLDLGRTYNNRGLNYFKTGKYSNALEDFFLSLKIFEPLNNVFVSTIYSNIAMLYTEIENMPKRFEYEIKAVKFAEKIGNENAIAFALTNRVIGLLVLKDYKNAEILQKKLKPIIVKLENSMYLHSYYFSNGFILSEKNKYLEAIDSYNTSLKYAHENEDPYQECDALSGLGNCYLKTNNLPLAKVYIDSLLQIANKNNIKSFQKIGYKDLSFWYEKRGDFKNSNIELNKYIAVTDSLITEETKKRTSIVEAKFETEKKETQIKLQTAQLKQKTTNNYLLVGSICTLAIISLLGFRNYIHRQKFDKQRITELETKQQLNATEAVLKGEEQERTRLAKDLHDGLGGMLSGIKHSFASIKGNMVMSADNTHTFERSLDMVDNSIKEMRRVAHNMMPEALVKFGLNDALKDYCGELNDSGVLLIKYNGIGIEKDQIDQSKAIAIYRIIQELTNNTIKHANAKSAIVQVINSENKINITVEDDGKGFDKTILNTAKGIGWSNIYNRVEFLKGSIEVDSEMGKGTSVFIEI